MPTFWGGEHFLALFYQGDVQWENQFRRNHNRQNPVIGSYFLEHLKSSEKARGCPIPPNPYK